MVQLLVHHQVEDFNKWKPFFEQHSDFRAQNGCKGGRVFRSSDNPNDLFILFEWDNIENVQKFAQSDNLKEIMQKAGVQGIPEVHFIEEISKTSA